MYPKSKTIRKIFSPLLLTLLLAANGFIVSASEPEGAPGQSDDDTVRVIKLHLSDQDDQPLAHLVVPEGEMGLYFDDTGNRAIGLLPKTNGDGAVEIAVYQVERHSEDEQTEELFQVLPPMVAGASEGVRLADIGNFTVKVIGTKMVKLPKDTAD